MPRPSFLQRLKERKLIQWAVAYLAAGFVVIQLLDPLKDPLSLSLVLQQAILACVVAGFFITLILAWFHGERGKQNVGAVELLLIIAVVASAGMVISMIGERSAEARDAGAPVSKTIVAVRPFVDTSTNGTRAYFGAGIADAILHLLGYIPEIGVIDRHSSFQQSISESEATVVGTQLGVDAVLDGESRVSGDTVHLAVKLVRTRDEAELWQYAYTWVKQLSLSDVVRDIAGALSNGGDGTSLQAPSLINFVGTNEAVDLYFRGGEEANRGSPESLNAAVRYFARVTEIDQDFAPAWAGLAAALLDLRFSESAVLETVKVLAKRALAIDSTSAEARVVIGRLLNEPGSLADGEREFRRAIQHQPSYAPARMWLGNSLMTQGKRVDGLHEFQAAAELDPLSPSIAVGLSQALSATGDADGAVREARRAMDLNPEYPWGYTALAVALEEVGESDEAIAISRRATEIHNHPNVWARHAVLLARSGNESEARRILRRLRQQIGEMVDLPTALIHGNLAELDSAFAALQRVRAWTPAARDWVQNGPFWSPVREDPRWVEFLRRHGMN